MTVNHDVVGSSPTGGAKVWPLGQVVKTPPFHGDNMGSNPVGVTTFSQVVDCCAVDTLCLILSISRFRGIRPQSLVVLTLRLLLLKDFISACRFVFLLTAQ